LKPLGIGIFFAKKQKQKKEPDHKPDLKRSDDMFKQKKKKMKYVTTIVAVVSIKGL